MQKPIKPENDFLLAGMRIEFRGDASVRASALRAFAGTTPTDAAVDALAIPARPVWLRIAIGLLRWYRTGRLIRADHRCVFEPSCSRYAELAWRQDGFALGCGKIIWRLWRCRPGAGGMDLP